MALAPLQKVSVALTLCATLCCALSGVQSIELSIDTLDDEIAMGKSTFPALCTAAAAGRTTEVRRLLAAGADIEERSPYAGCTPLHCAANFGRVAVVRLLLIKGADMSAKALDGTPLQWARWQVSFSVL